MSTQQNRTFKRYKIIEFLGKGGQGQVYQAYDPIIKRHIAIKWMPFSHCFYESFIERFLLEVQTLGRLHHSNIVKIYEVGTTNNGAYIVMELVNGITLYETMVRETFSINKSISTIKTIAETIAYIHKNGIIHRDLKPTNIMVDKNNRIVVMDFGASKHLNNPNNLTQKGQKIGTPGYMAPEQVLEKSVTFATDIYALGVILYELLTMTPPINMQGNITQILHNIVYSNPIPAHKINPQVPKNLSDICCRALHKKQEFRYEKVELFIRALRECIN